MLLQELTGQLAQIVASVPRARIAGLLSRLATGQALGVAVSAEGLDRRDRASLLALECYLSSADASPQFISATLEALYLASSSRTLDAQVVWTGPRVPGSTAYLQTLVIARKLVEDSRERILIAGYSITMPALERLGLASAIARGVSVDVIVNKAQLGESDYRAMLAQGIRVFRAAPSAGDFSKFHVKAIIADGKNALVGSANFTSLGQSHNIEIGLYVSGSAARSIESVLDGYLKNAAATGWVVDG